MMYVATKIDISNSEWDEWQQWYMTSQAVPSKSEAEPYWLHTD